MSDRTTTRERRPGAHTRRRRRRSGIRPLRVLFLLVLVGAAAYLLVSCILPEGETRPDPAPGEINTPVDPAGEGNSSETWSDLTGSQPVEPDIVPEPPTIKDPEPTLPGEPDWRLLLVNTWTTLPEDYKVTLKQLKNNQSVDERCYPDLQDMMDACRADGLKPIICSSFRTWEKQEKLYQNKIKRLVDAGMDPEIAPEEAGKVVAIPGTSEHQLGLAVDIVDVDYQVLDEAQEDTAVQKWLMEHSWEYGFILRYPNEKSDVTGIIYEPWHYRYVGKEAAKEIYEQGVCLEEYLAAKEANN